MLSSRIDLTCDGARCRVARVCMWVCVCGMWACDIDCMVVCGDTCDVVVVGLCVTVTSIMCVWGGGVAVLAGCGGMSYVCNYCGWTGRV